VKRKSQALADVSALAVSGLLEVVLDQGGQEEEPEKEPSLSRGIPQVMCIYFRCWWSKSLVSGFGPFGALKRGDRDSSATYGY